MAGIGSTYLLGGAGTAAIMNREDLLDMVSIIDPWETPLVVASPKETVNHVVHEWLTDTLAATSTAGACEGADFNESTDSAPSRLNNITQIFRKDFKVTNTQRAVNPAGASDFYAYSVQKALKEVTRNLEGTCFYGSAGSAAGTTGTSRTMKRLSDFITTNRDHTLSTAWGIHEGTTAPTSNSATLMTETRFNVLLEQIFNQGGNPDSVYVSGPTKRQISGFSGQGASRRNIAMAEKKLIASVDMYDSDFGLVQIVLDRWVRAVSGNTATNHTSTSGDMWAIETPLVRIGFLRPIRHVPLPPVGDATRGMVLGEATLVVLNEKACGSFWGCASYSGAQG